MRKFPLPEPGEPDIRSTMRFFVWLFGQHWTAITVGVLWGCVWLLSMAFTPYAVGSAVDRIIAKDATGLLTWTAAVLGLAAVTALGSIMRHRADVCAQLGVAYRVVQLVTRHVTRLGAALDKRVAAGEVVAVGTTDITRLSYALEVLARGIGSVVAIVAVTLLLLFTSVPMGLVVLVGVPLLLLATGPLLRPLHSRAEERRDRQYFLTERAGDIISGLRVLRGIGGERIVGDRYRADSHKVRDAGVQVAKVESVLQSAEVLLPGLLMVGVVWIGAQFTVAGDLTPGELVTFYGYTAFLVLPMRMVTESFSLLVGGHVAAGRVVRVLGVAAPAAAETQDAVPVEAVPVDAESGLSPRPGRLTAVVGAVPEPAIALAERLGGLRGGEVTLDGRRLAELPTATVRRHILVDDNDSWLFGGTVRQILGERPSAEVNAALEAACAQDLVEALPDGLDTSVVGRGLSFSGGERQRLRLARALLADPAVLVLVEPTSAVDAHTESRIATRLAAARRDRTTIVVSSSPLLLDHADDVVFLEDGKVTATGTHRELVASAPAYAATVLREES